MKKIIFVLSILLTVVLSPALANNEKNIDPKILAAFQKEFAFAENVKWSAMNEFTAATFSLYGNGFTAWYNTDGELSSVTRNILYMELPLSVIKTIENRFTNAEFSGISEVTRNNQTIYYLHMEKKGKKYLLKAYPAGDVTIVRKLTE